MDSSNARFITYMFTDLFGFCYFVLPVVLAFAAQLLCFRAKHIPPKLLSPGMVLLILAAVYGAFLVFGESLLYLFPLGIAGLILLGSLSAWLVYAVARTFRRLTKKTPHC